jgi:peptidoglycan hydrolase CwlO-like protein
MKHRLYIHLLSLIVVSTFIAPVFANVNDEIVTRQQQIDEIQRQINQYQLQIDSSRTQSLS